VTPGAVDPDVHLRAVPHDALRRTSWAPHEVAESPDVTPAAEAVPLIEAASGPVPGEDQPTVATAKHASGEQPDEATEDPAPAQAGVRQVRLREEVRADALLSVVSTVEAVSLTALVVKAVAMTTRRVPLLNGTSSVTDVAVQRWTEAGTIAPVVHVAGLMTASSVTSTLRGLDARLRDGRVASGELHAATVTVVDLGTFRAAEASLDATAGHPAVLAMGGVREQAVIEDGVVVPGQTMTVTLSCDADRIEASTAALWLTQLAKVLEQPLHFLT
jgi:pyruvate dehydrogenase E2 component (dihydrolipoyllysine-residue acetyltransferase)